MNDCEKISREGLLKEVMALNFAITDISLYLDTHPRDTEAIELHNEYVEKYNVASEKYVKLYGPLTINNLNADCNYWHWIDEPWPWERSGY